MSNENAPFYEGQKMVRIGKTVPGFVIKGDTYTSAGCVRCPHCGEWYVGICELPDYTDGIIGCGCDLEFKSPVIFRTGLAKNFAPLNPYSSDATKELIEKLDVGDKADMPVKILVNN